MAKDTNFARQTTEQAMQTADWMRAIAEQNLNQSKAAFESLLTMARNAASGVDQQAAFISDSILYCLLKRRSKIHSTSLTSSFV